MSSKPKLHNTYRLENLGMGSREDWAMSKKEYKKLLKCEGKKCVVIDEPVDNYVNVVVVDKNMYLDAICVSHLGFEPNEYY